MDTPLLSVCLITYNHGEYISQAIDSILMQKVNFNFELIIADDCSKDKTQSIISAYRDKHPTLIKPILRQKNVGAAQNFIELIATPESKYIAYLEGDDFWTDPYKLQKQVDFLEAHPDFEVCFTNIKMINAKGEIKKEALITDNRPTEYEQKDLPIWAPTLTRVFRNRDFSPIDTDVPGQDTLWLLYQSKFGKIKFLNEITGTYRLHDGAIYSAMSDVKRKEAVFVTFLECLKFINRSLFSKYFGLLFKKLVEIRGLDSGLFILNRKKLRSNFKMYHAHLTFIEKIKIQFSFLITAIPFLSNSKAIKSFILKVLDRFFIY